MKILVLGATGFLGRNLVEKFAPHHEVHAVWHERKPFESPAVQWHQIDLRMPFEMEPCDVLLQFAACSSGCKDTLQSPAMHINNNTLMNSLIFKAAVDAKVKHVIFPSCSVMLPNGHNDENVTPQVRKEYLGFASMKLYFEKMCEFYSNITDTKFTVMRNSNFYGAHDKFDLAHSHVFGATITKVLTAKDKITVWGTGEEARDFVHVSDFCNFVESVIEKQTDKFKLFNCGSGIATPINTLVAEIIKASGKEIAVEHDLSAPSIPTSLSLDCTKAREELGWTPVISLPEGIKRTIKWWQGNMAYEVL